MVPSEQLGALLLDLEHDLGKHLRLPLALLPTDAGAGEVRAAVAEALLRTRRSPDGDRSARELWSAFLGEVGSPPHSRSWPDLVRAVEAALSLEEALPDGEPALERGEVEATLAAVGAAIRLVREELDGNP